ncbi:MAG: hypothetical protein QF574_05755 [Arenicellales bacterium]|nr:hypothetical protein [Arenicellales bacterium]
MFNEELMVKVVESGADAMTINFPDKLNECLFNNGHTIDQLGSAGQATMGEKAG